MTASDKTEDRLAHAVDEPKPADMPMGEEEKILAGRTDVNLPALLTRDVMGG